MLTTVIFLSLAAFGFIIVALGFLIGADHDIHDFDHDASHDGEANSISIFSPKVMGLFVLAFGAAGACASTYHLGVAISSLIGVGSGFILGGIAYLLLNFLHGQQANSLVESSSLIGCPGMVVTRIPSGGLGEVSYVVNGLSDTALALSKGSAELSVGTRVKIVAVGGGNLVVDSAIV